MVAGEIVTRAMLDADPLGFMELDAVECPGVAGVAVPGAVEEVEDVEWVADGVLLPHNRVQKMSEPIWLISCPRSKMRCMR